MVRIKNNKLIIEIKTQTPSKSLEYFQTGLIEALSLYDYDTHGRDESIPIFALLQETFSAFEDENTLFIEIETDEPKPILKYYQEGINNFLMIHDYEEHGKQVVLPLFLLLQEITIISN